MTVEGTPSSTELDDSLHGLRGDGSGMFVTKIAESLDLALSESIVEDIGSGKSLAACRAARAC